MEFFCVYIGLIFVFFHFSVSRDGICQDIIKSPTSQQSKPVSQTKCVSNISCLQTEMYIDVSWKLPGDNRETADFIVSLNNTQTGIIKHSLSISTNTENYRTNYPVLWNVNYTAIVLRRYSQDGYKMYSLSKDCKKVFQTSIPKSHFTTKWTRRRQGTTGFERNKTDSPLASLEGINDSKDTTEVFRIGKFDPKRNVKEEHVNSKETDIGNNGTRRGSLKVIIGSSAAGCLILITVGVIIVRKRITGNGPKVVSNTTNEANNDQDNVYNHLSQDARDRASREQTNNYEDEEDTYNRLTLRYRDKGNKQEPASNAKCPQQPATTDGPQSLQFGTIYDKVSINNRIDNETKSVAVKEASEDSDGLMQKDHKIDDLEDLSTNDKYASVNKHNSSQIDTNLDRKKGPKGDLYTSVSIKR